MGFPHALLIGRVNLLLVALCSAGFASAQDNAVYYRSTNAIQYGYSLKARLDYSNAERLTFTLGVSGGIGSFVGKNWFYQAINSDVILYRGGIGSNRPGRKTGKWLDLETVISYTATAGLANRLRETSPARPGIRNYPLYYFNTRNLPALQNPYRWSITLGSNTIIFLTGPQYKKQQVGFLGLHLDRFQVGYINDGPPFFPPLADMKDRYHTGGIFGTFHGDDQWALNLVEVGFNKFTGYSPSSYELSNKLGSSYVFYRNRVENFYNKSNIYLNVGNTATNWGVSMIAYNFPRLDLQHRIHNNKYYPLHLVPYPKALAVGPIGYFQQIKIGLQ